MRLTDNFFIAEMAAIWRDNELILVVIDAIDDRDTKAFVLIHGLTYAEQIAVIFSPSAAIVPGTCP